MSQQPEVYHLLANLDTTESNAPVALINSKKRFLVKKENLPLIYLKIVKQV